MEFLWRLFLMVQLTIDLHWFRQWLDAEQASVYWHIYIYIHIIYIYAILGFDELNTRVEVNTTTGHNMKTATVFFVPDRKIQWLLLDSFQKEPVMRSFDAFVAVWMNMLLKRKTQWSGDVTLIFLIKFMQSDRQRWGFYSLLRRVCILVMYFSSYYSSCHN